MNRKIISIIMALSVACYPASILKADEVLIKEVTSEKQESLFTIEPDIKSIRLKVDSRTAMVNQRKDTLNAAPVIINGKLYVPYKFVLQELFDSNGRYDAKNKTLSISQYKKTLVLYEGKKKALINGQTINIDTPPIVKKGILLVPIKLISDTFNISFSFDSKTNTVWLTLREDLTQPVIGTRPTAKFSFERAEYIAGEMIIVQDQSFDVDGDTIVERQWQVNDDKSSRTWDIESFLKTPPPGVNYISLRVKDSRRNWSEWHTQRITVQPNKAPVITSLTIDKDQLAQGEKIELHYAYENEEWETIAEEQWSYRYAGEKNILKESITGKPHALFYPGAFIIELQLKDAYGNISEKKEIPIHITEQVKQTELDYKFKEGNVGTVIDNFHNFNYSEYALVDNYTVTNTGAKLLMSNSPESVREKGILYKDVIQGSGRILYHHRNMIEDPSENKRLVIIMENKNPFSTIVTKRREGTKGPTSDILFAGSQLLVDFLKKDFYDEYTLGPNEKKYLFDSAKKQWNKGDTVSGMIELYCNEEVHFTIAMVGQDTQLADVETLPILKRDGIHSRGSFENADRYYTLNLDNDKPYKIMLGKPANDMEDWLQGYDALTGEKVMNKGNYGMVYWMRLHVKEDTGILFNLRSNIFKGAVGFTNGGSYEMPYRGLVKNVQQGYVAGVAKEGKITEMLYVLPNGSAAPILFCFIPKSQWNK